MKKTLVIFAHPYFEYSSANAELVRLYEHLENVTFKDLYEEYSDFHIATFRERKRIKDYERLVFHFPIIWFGLPPLLKLWIDEVFDMKWLAEDEHPLLHKDAIIIATAGGSEENYRHNGRYKTTVPELLKSLTLSLMVNNIEVKEIIAIHHADALTDHKRREISAKIIKTLKNE